MGYAIFDVGGRDVRHYAVHFIYHRTVMSTHRHAHGYNEPLERYRRVPYFFPAYSRMV